MSKLSPIWKIFLSYLLLIFFILLASNLFGQTKFCKQEICVVEFNADWNKENSVQWLNDLKDCGITRVNIDESKTILEQYQKEYGIIVVPTIIVFNGKEVKRFQACLRFKMGATREDVQAAVDEIIMNKF